MDALTPPSTHPHHTLVQNRNFGAKLKVRVPITGKAIKIYNLKNQPLFH